MTLLFIFLTSALSAITTNYADCTGTNLYGDMAKHCSAEQVIEYKERIKHYEDLHNGIIKRRDTLRNRITQ